MAKLNRVFSRFQRFEKDSSMSTATPPRPRCIICAQIIPSQRKYRADEVTRGSKVLSEFCDACVLRAPRRSSLPRTNPAGMTWNQISHSRP